MTQQSYSKSLSSSSLSLVYIIWHCTLHTSSGVAILLRNQQVKSSAAQFLLRMRILSSSLTWLLAISVIKQIIGIGITYMPEQQSENCMCICALLHKRMCLFRSLAHSTEDMSGCVFRSLLSLRVLMCVFSSAPFGLSVTAVKHITVWTAGRVHTLSINPPLRVHVLTCVCVLACGCGWSMLYS